MRGSVIFRILGFSAILLFSAEAVWAQAPTDTAAAMKNKGVGPVKKVKIGPIKKELAEDGQKLFEAKCTACHKFDQRYVGPALGGVTERRRPEWIMNMILNPAEMVQKDPIAKALLAEHFVTMTFQNVTQPEARAILEYFRSQDADAKDKDKDDDDDLDKDKDKGAQPAEGAGAQQPKPRKKLPGT